MEYNKLKLIQNCGSKKLAQKMPYSKQNKKKTGGAENDAKCYRLHLV